MDLTYRRTLLTIALIGIAYFVLFIFPNNTGAKDPMMISIFAGDEFAQYGVVMKMHNSYAELKDTC